MPEWMDNSFWATIGLVVFLALVARLGLPRIVGTMLDKRIQQIADELENAQKLRDDAAALLEEYEQKRIVAESEAEEIIKAAKEEAQRLTSEAQVSLAELVARRTKAVEDKIVQAEAQAIAEVLSRSADIAINAARVVLVDEMSKKGGEIINRSIAGVGNRLN